MVYRSLEEPLKPGGLVTVQSYLDPIAAQMDRAHLESEGIPAHVIEAASFNPLVAAAAGGVQLQVSKRDLERAQAFLLDARSGTDAQVDDGEGGGVVRCPRCELAYCYHERGTAPPAIAAVFVVGPLVWLLARPFTRKRWHCRRCRHVWDDRRDGPDAMTPMEPGDPRPIFRLQRSHAGMGLFIGLLAGSLVALLGGSDMAMVALPAAVAVGLFVGSSWRHSVCSEPSCRAPLPAGADECPSCKGSVAGQVRSAEEHYAAAADFRRELASLRREPAVKAPAPRVKSAKKPRAKRPAPTDTDAG